MNEANCQYTFGVFTKWDKVLQEHKESNSKISLEDFRETNTKKFLEYVNSEERRAEKDYIFFVDSEHVFRKEEVSFLLALKCP